MLSLKGPALSAPATTQAPDRHAEAPPGTVAVLAPLQGMLIELSVSPGDTVLKRQPVAVMEALKMEHVVLADVAGVVREFALEIGDTIFEETPIMFIEPQTTISEAQPSTGWPPRNSRFTRMNPAYAKPARAVRHPRTDMKRMGR